jgi:hypothetical protein
LECNALTSVTSPFAEQSSIFSTGIAFEAIIQIISEKQTQAGSMAQVAECLLGKLKLSATKKEGRKADPLLLISALLHLPEAPSSDTCIIH